MKTFATVLLVAGSIFALVAGVSAAEPTQADFDACNRAALGTGSNPSASPSAGGATGPSITTPSGTPDTTAGVRSGGTADKTGPMITGTGRSAWIRRHTSSPSNPGSMMSSTTRSGEVRRAAATAPFKTAYQDCMKQRGF